MYALLKILDSSCAIFTFNKTFILLHVVVLILLLEAPVGKIVDWEYPSQLVKNWDFQMVDKPIYNQIRLETKTQKSAMLPTAALR